MAYCGPRGIPHSSFLTWSHHDQDLAIAWMAEESIKCPECGTLPEEWLDEYGMEKEDPPFVVTSVECRGCANLAAERKLIPETAPGITLHFARPGAVERKNREHLLQMALFELEEEDD